MRVFITATFKGEENKDEIEKLCLVVKQSGFDDFCFIRDVEKYQKLFDDPKVLMKMSKEEIIKSDAILIDVTHKSSGRAIEAGISFANNKKIITIVKNGTFLKDTIKGISDIIIEYENIEDIIKPLTSFYESIK